MLRKRKQRAILNTAKVEKEKKRKIYFQKGYLLIWAFP